MPREYSNIPKGLAPAAYEIVAAHGLITSTGDKHATFDALQTFTDLTDQEWQAGVKDLERHGVALTAQSDEGAQILVFTGTPQMQSPQWVLDAAKLSQVAEYTRQHDTDALTLIAEESRRRGFSTNGQVTTKVWQALTDLIRYGDDGQRLATGTPATPARTPAEAITRLPDSVWLDAGATPIPAAANAASIATRGRPAATHNTPATPRPQPDHAPKHAQSRPRPTSREQHGR